MKTLVGRLMTLRTGTPTEIPETLIKETSEVINVSVTCHLIATVVTSTEVIPEIAGNGIENPEDTVIPVIIVIQEVMFVISEM